jgi:hypothetical protein
MNTLRALLDRVGRKTWLAGLVAFLGLSILSVSWAVATPLSSSPDEPAHIVKAAAVVRGELIGDPTNRPGFTSVTVPSSVGNAWGWTCPAYHPQTTADCQAIHGDSTLRSVVTSAGLYNPTYYALVGWPSLLLHTPHAAVFAMRIVSGILCSFFFAVAFTALMLLRRTFFAGIAFLAIATPTTLFLSGAVNPNALEVATGSALLSLLLLLVAGPPLRRIGPALTLVAISGFLLANLRGLSPLWMALIAAIALLAASRGRIRALFSTRVAWVTLGVLAVGAASGTGWTIKTDSLGQMGSFQGAGTSPLQAFVTMLLDRSPDPGMIGLFGWLDTPAPAAVYAIWSFLVLAVVLTAVIVARGRMLGAVLLSVAGFFLLPAIVQAASVQSSGYIWQGRYSLLAYASVLIVSAFAIASSELPLTAGVNALVTRAVLTLGGLATVGQAFAFASTLKRYAVGESASWAAFILHPRWQAPGSDLAWILASLVGAALIVFVWLGRTREEAVPRTEDTAALFVLAWLARPHRRGNLGRKQASTLPGAPSGVPTEPIDVI